MRAERSETHVLCVVLRLGLEGEEVEDGVEEDGDGDGDGEEEKGTKGRDLSRTRKER